VGAHILVVDDESDLLDTLQPALAAHGYRVSTARDGETALSLAAAHPPDLILLDLIMPGLDGFEVCQRLRADTRLRHIPIVMLTALHEIPAVVRGLDTGADDYVTKPFDLPELLLRIRARLAAPHAGPLRVGDLVISRARHELRRDGRTEPLTPRELDLVELFARQPNQVLSRQTVLAAVWGGDDGAASAVDVYIGRLRRKLAALQSAVRLRTVRGDGFVLDTPQE
jgi:DNA-binding response OmpR family regulator